MTRKRLLDLFCGAGGASVGYARAGFEVWGVDRELHRGYPHRMVVADAMDVLGDRWFLDSFDVIHASPPCQAYTYLKNLGNSQQITPSPDLVDPVRDTLLDWGGTYVIENVPGAPLREPTVLCGSMFGLGVRRHRLFESNATFVPPRCRHLEQGTPVGVYGSMGDVLPTGGRTATSIEEAQAAMGIDWMRWHDLVEAIPPAMTELLGQQLLHGPPAPPTDVESRCRYCLQPLPGTAGRLQKFCGGLCRTAAYRERLKAGADL